LSGSQTRGTGEQRDSNPVARPDDFMNMPKPDKDTREGIHAWYRIDNHVFRHEIPSDFLSQHLIPESKAIKAFIATPEIAEDLRLWDQEDIYRLGIQQVLAELNSEQLKNLPVDDWIQLPTPSSVRSLIEGFNEISEDED
jgi:hypothetical protein